MLPQPDDFFLFPDPVVYDIPVPGIEAVCFTPFFPTLIVEPFPPMDVDIPFLPTFNLTPGAILYDFLNLNGI